MKDSWKGEWMRTVLLLLLLAIAIGFILWTRHLSDVNFTNTLR
ncbi:MAG TPA: hypothetical protein VLG37_04165 [Candidatus Saccharimonadales bacterium]|nr:hypothetical protein [Candidatus Saccharimonadales bacterium]